MRRIAILLATAAVALVAATAAAADGAPVFDTNLYFNCLGDNNIGVPNGDDLTVHLGWAAKNKGLVHDFLNAASMTAAVGGVQIANPMQYWSAPFYVDGTGWETRWVYDVGVITFSKPTSLDFTLDLDHQLGDGLTLEGTDNHRPFFWKGRLLETSGCSIGAF